MREDDYKIRRYELPKSKQPKIIKEKTAISSIYFTIKILFITSLTLLLIILAIRLINTDKIKDIYKSTVAKFDKEEPKTAQATPTPTQSPHPYILPPHKNEVIDNFHKETKSSIDKMQEAQRERMRKYREEQAKKIAQYQAEQKARMSKYIAK